MQQSNAELASSRAFDYMRALRRTVAIVIAIAIACSPLFALLPNRTHQAAWAQSSSDLFVYGDALAVAWQDWSWNTTVSFTNAAPTFNGSAASIAITYNQPWAGALLGTHSPVATAGYTAIAFRAYGASPATQIRVFAKLGSTGQDTSFVEIAVPGGMWTEVVVPFSQLGDPESISAIAIQDSTGVVQPTFFIDDVRLISSALSTPVDVPEIEPIASPEVIPPVTSEEGAGALPTPEVSTTDSDNALEESSDMHMTCCAELGYRVYLPLALGDLPRASATTRSEIIGESTASEVVLETVQSSDNFYASPIEEFAGPTLSLTMTLDGRIHLTWTSVPDAIFYNLRYDVGDWSETVQVTDTQWISDSLSIAGADVITFSVLAITSQGTSLESNIVSLERSNRIVPDYGNQLAQPMVTAADCQRLAQQLLYRNQSVEDTPTQKHRRELWVYAGTIQCLSLLADELGLMGSRNYWNCELMLRPYAFGAPPSTTAWMERFWRKAIAKAGSSQICRQLKALSDLAANVSAVRNAANACAYTGAVKWTLQMDTVTTITPGSGNQPPKISTRYLFSIHEILCVQPKPIRYFTTSRIVYTDGTSERIDPSAVRSAFRDLSLVPQPLIWSKTEAIAHRGDRVSSPDNTNEAIKRALEKGAKYIEIDTQLASDGKVIIAHGSIYKPGQGIVPDAPTYVYGPTTACHNKNMEVDVTPFLTGNCDIGTQMALASEGTSWLPKFRGERYLLLQNVVTDPRYRDYCGWFVEMKNSEHPTENKTQRNKRLGEVVQAILRQSGVVERCANRGQNVWVTSFEDSALEGVNDDRIYKLRVVSRFSLINWPAKLDTWLALGYDGVAIDLAVAGSTVVEGPGGTGSKPLPEYIRSRGLKVVAYTLLPGSQTQSTNQEAIARKLDYFLTDILDDLLIRNGDQRPSVPIYTLSLPTGELRSLVIRNYEAYAITATLFLNSYGVRPLPVAPTVPGDSWSSLPFETSPTNSDMLAVEQTSVTPYLAPAYDTPNYVNFLYYKTYLVGQPTVNTLVRGAGLLTMTMQHQLHSNVKPRLVSVGIDRAQFTVKGIAMPTSDGRNEVAVCPSESISVSGRLIPAAGWQLNGTVPVRLFWDNQSLPTSGATLRPTLGKHELRIVGEANDMGLIEPRALNQKRSIMLRITVNVVPRASGCS